MHKKLTLDEANRFIETNKRNVDSRYRHHYHVMAPIGWINDPNGFVFFKGEYHLFFQHYPYDSSWGPMHWGHVKSKDLIHWEELPVALAPEHDYEKDGCFSGSAIEKEGKLYLMYTGHAEHDGKIYQTQCIAVSEDGIHFEKSAHNPVISRETLANYGSIHDFRDPKVFERQGIYYSVIASKSEDNRGRILLFESQDLIEWQFSSVLLEGDKTQGIMWECPDLFHLDGKDVLIMSPIQIPKKGFEYDNISSTVAFIGMVNWETKQFDVQNYHEIDFGLDFYAPQTLEDDQGRRIMIAWMQMWDRTLPTHELGHLWAGAMTLPRELSIKENQLIQKPVSMVYDHLTVTQTLNDVRIEKSAVEWTDVVTDTTYLHLIAHLQEAEQLTIQFAKNSQNSLIIRYDKINEVLTLSREDFGHSIIGREAEQLVGRKVHVPLRDNQLNLEIFRDTSSIELFANDYKTMTATFYEIEKGHDLAITAKGQVNLSLVELGTID